MWVKPKTWVQVRKNGLLVCEGPNVIVNAGYVMLATALAGGDGPSHMAMGSDATVTDEDMTALQGTEHERVSLTAQSLGARVRFEATFGSSLTGNVTVNEFGIFDANSAGNMLCRFNSAEFTATTNDEVDVSWEFEYGEPN